MGFCVKFAEKTQEMCAAVMRRYGHINTPSRHIPRYYNYTIKPGFVNVFYVKKTAREAVFTVF